MSIQVFSQQVSIKCQERATSSSGLFIIFNAGSYQRAVWRVRGSSVRTSSPTAPAISGESKSERFALQCSMERPARLLPQRKHLDTTGSLQCESEWGMCMSVYECV